jgi:SAM-dependent methyltransferase
VEITPAQDRINRHAWRSRSARHWFGSLHDWTDPGEAAAVAWVADQVRDQPLLDVGVGGGRTVPLLTQISSNYTGVDYTQELVTICRRNYPGARVEHMDARDMSAFDDNTFALVMFSFNGIDAVDYEGRRKILREVARVLKPGGLALFFDAQPARSELSGKYLSPPAHAGYLGRSDQGRHRYSEDDLQLSHWRIQLFSPLAAQSGIRWLCGPHLCCS